MKNKIPFMIFIFTIFFASLFFADTVFASCGDEILDYGEQCEHPESTDKCSYRTCQCNSGYVPDPGRSGFCCFPTTEVCDGIDNDCDGLIDEDVKTTFYLDADGDSYGDQNNTTQACSAPSGYVSNNLDCNDSDVSIHPGATEIPNDGIDQNCDGIDTKTCYVDNDQDGYGSSETILSEDGTCDTSQKESNVSGDCNDNNPSIKPGISDLCDGVDNNCNGAVDENFDAGDSCSTGFGECYAIGNKVCSQNGMGTFCNAVAGTPSAELCDGKDNDCDGVSDEGVTNTYYRDADNDNYGNPVVSMQACNTSYGYVLDNQDCNDTNAYIYPGVSDVCDEFDNNCNGTVDEIFDTGVTCSVGVGECYSTGSKVCSQDGLTTVCNAVAGTPNPDICDGKDNDCDGTIDEDLGSTTCGWGICTHTVNNCIDGLNQTCDPFAGALTEICDGIDNDCDGSADEELGTTTCGLGVCNHTVNNCVFGLNQTCDPFAGALTEIRDGLDNDCDGEVDEYTYQWSGFFQPVNNPGPFELFNRVNAGRAIPVRFGLGGNMGLNIFATGYPKSFQIDCTFLSIYADPIEITVPANESSLKYFPIIDQYIYVWKTEKSWNGCRRLVVKLNDGTTKHANFRFVKF